MKLTGKVSALERSLAASAKLCCVEYKANQGPEGDVMLPVDRALQEAKSGRVKRISFPLTFDEEQAERLHAGRQLERWLADLQNGIRRDTETPSVANLILCSKPIIFARQAPPRGHVGGYFITEDGTPFHQTEWRKILDENNAGFVIVRDYDETKEPWYKERKNQQ